MLNRVVKTWVAKLCTLFRHLKGDYGDLHPLAEPGVVVARIDKSALTEDQWRELEAAGFLIDEDTHQTSGSTSSESTGSDTSKGDC